MFVFHLVPLYTICLAFATELSAPDARYNNIASDIKASIYVYHNNPEGTHNSDNQVNKTVPWDTYINVLKKASTKVLQNIRSNIKQNYFLDSNLIRLIDELFSDIGDYEYIIQSKLKKIMGRDQFNDTKEFMLDFMTLSNLLMDKMVGYNLEKIEIVSPTKWYKTL